MGKQRGGQLSSVGGGGEEGMGGGMGGGGPLLGPEPPSPSSPSKRTPDLGKKCEPGLKSDLSHSSSSSSFTPKLKTEPVEPAGPLCEAELSARRLAALSDHSEHLSGRKESLLGPGPHYGLGKEEDQCRLAPHHLAHSNMAAMGLEPNLHHLTDPGVGCNNFSVDSIMTTSRDGSPTGLQQDTGGYRTSWTAGGNSPSYPACLYPGQTSLEELSNMTAACLNNQNQMGSLYPRPSWYSIPGHHSPSNLPPPDQPFPQPREYFEPLGKAPSPIQACDQVPYRSPSYRTNYYSQECDKY